MRISWLLAMTLAFSACSSGQNSSTNPVPVASPTPEPTPTTSPNPEPAQQEPPGQKEWAAALDRGLTAAQAAQTADSEDEWKDTANLWNQAIAAMDTVPAESPHAAEASTKASQYREYQAIAVQHAEKAATAWIPEGFTQKGDMAWKYLMTGSYDCPLGIGNCFGLDVVSKESCSTLYGEIVLLDAEGRNIGMANDMASGVQSGQVVRLVMPDSGNEGATTLRVNELNCIK